MGSNLIGTFQIAGERGQVSGEMHRWMERQTREAAALETGKAAKTQTWEQSFFIPNPVAKDYRLVVKARVARTITNVVAKTASGTCSLTVKIDSTALGGGSAISVTSTESDTAYTTNNNLSIEQDIVFTVGSVSSPLDLSITLSGTLTLA